MHNLLTQKGPSRRNFLKGAGLALMLPQFASLAKDRKDIEAPKRMAFLHVPNGIIMDKWTPKKAGAGFDLPETLQPLKELQGDFSMISGLMHDKAKANGDGAGDHVRASGTFLTGVQVLKSAKTLRNGISVDQIAASQIGHHTYLPSLELSSQEARLTGSCDNGYSCAYRFNISWAGPKQPMVPETSPELAFNRIFTVWDGKKMSKEQALVNQRKKSVLDFLRESSFDLKRNLGKEDVEKLDQYYASLRQFEKRMQKEKPKLLASQLKRKFESKPGNFKDHLDTLSDLMVLAFEADATRICTFIVGDEGSNRSFPELGVKGGHHSLSHHLNDKNKIKDLEKIDKFYTERLAYLLKGLKNTKVDGVSLLDQSMVLYGCAISDGNRHNHEDLPILLAGKGGGSIKPGIHHKMQKAPLCNMYLGMLEKFGTPSKSLGDSTGIIRDF